MELGIAGRRAIVTGGSKGLGFAIAQELVREGAHVAICARTEDEVAAAGEALRAGGTTVYAQAADVTDAALDRRLRRRVRRRPSAGSTSSSTTRAARIRAISRR